MVTVTLAKAICSHLTDNVAANSPVHMPRAHGEEYQRDRTDQGYFTRGISLAELPGFSKEMGPDIYRQTQILGRLISNSALRLRIIAMALCLSVCLSVTSRSSIKTDERIELVSGTGASFHPSSSALERKFGYLQNKCTFLWDFVLTPDLRISIVETCYQLSSTKVDTQSVKNWTVVGQLS